MRFLPHVLLAASLLACLAACSSGPEYVRPSIELPAAYKEGGPWKPAQPQLADAHHPWWEVFSDPELDRLEKQADAASQTLRQLDAVYREARAQVDLSRLSGMGPQLEKKLNDAGIFHYWQFASMTPEDAARVDAEAKLSGRIEREGWIQQARALIENA